jgi:hypothetical protein
MLIALDVVVRRSIDVNPRDVLIIEERPVNRR